MFESLKADLRRYRNQHESLFTAYGFHATAVYRFGKWSERRIALLKFPLLLVYCVLERMIRALYDIRIKRAAIIGPGLYIAHFGGIVLGECSIGSGVAVAQRVVIDGNDEGAPTVGDSVWVGPHARIIGPIRIGKGATLASGAVVANDVADGCLVMGEPARTTMRYYDNRPINDF